MKRLLILVALTVCIATAKGQETFNITQLGDTLELCDYITQVTIEKDPSYNGTTLWINGNNEVFQEDYLVIDVNNNDDGKVVYIEKDNCYMKCCYIAIKPNNMPAPSTDTAWLQEDLWYNPEPLTLKATPEDMGYIYTWRSTNWPIDSTLVSYELLVGNAGDYLGGMVDECLHYSEKEIFVEKAPVIGYVTTNLNLNLNELHWTPKGSTYDTIAIYRNGYIVTIEDKHTGIWVDPVFNNEGGTPWYTMRAIKNGRIITESESNWKTGLHLELQNETTQTIYLGFYGLDMAYPLGNYVQNYKLYSVEESTELNQVLDGIPVGTTELEVPNDHNTWVISAILWNGIEVYSNMVFTTGGTMSNNEKHQKDIQIYPNPTTGILNFSEFINSEFRISDLYGRIVMSGRLEQQLDVSSLAKGIYTIEINGGDHHFTKEFILR